MHSKNNLPKNNDYNHVFNMNINELGDTIKKVRKERKLTQEQLGKLIGVQKSQISKIENNNRNITIGTIQRVFKALETNIKFIVNIDPKKR